MSIHNKIQQFKDLNQGIVRDKSKEPVATSSKASGCSGKHCRLGDRKCKSYWSCRDTCKIENKRITSMEKCPDESN